MTLLKNASKWLHRMMVPVYRTFGVLTLYSFLIFVLGATMLFGFYALNNSWCAPVVLTASEDHILSLTSQIVSSTEALGTLTLSLDQSRTELVILSEQRQHLLDLRARLEREIPKELLDSQQRQQRLEALNADKETNSAVADELATQLNDMQRQVQSDLANGLITKTDATTLLASLNSQRVSATDEKITEIAVQDAITQKGAESTTWLAVHAQVAALDAQIAQIDIALATAHEQIGMNMREISELKVAISKAKETPYYLASQSNHSVFAFVAYDSLPAAKIGAKVYNCTLSMILCREAGTITAVYGDEEQAINPILKTPVRGVLIGLSLAHEEDGRSKTLMMGSKPLGI